jgi:uncharacterized surface protein with fasciclin (FAS1) repeats
MRRIFAGLLAGALALGIVAGPVAAAGGSQNIVDTAIAVNSDGPFKGQFDTLIAAVLAADPAVARTLSGKGQFTVFAPTDAAFAMLGLNPDNVGALPKAALTNILLYHVARGERLAADVVDSSRIRTLYGAFVKVDGTVLTDKVGRDANIIVTDVRASNGVIHAIDSVLLPFVP